MSFDRTVKGDLPSPSPLFALLSGEIIGPSARYSSRAKMVWAAFGASGWYVLPREDWPDDLSALGDQAAASDNARFWRGLTYPQHWIV